MGRRNACVMPIMIWVFSTVCWPISSLASAGTSSFSSVIFPLTYIDAESSLVRSVAADPSDLPTTMPMRGFVAAGRAIRLRLEKQRESMLAAKARGRKPLSGKLSYNKDIVGDFYLTVPVGTPPQHLIFLVDTGSEFSWSQCSPCPHCNATHAPRFALNKSTSFLRVPCDSVLCQDSLGLSVTRPCNANTTRPLCIFTVEYGDGSVDAGIISVDSFALGPHYSKPMVFGCAVAVLDTVINPSSGLLGLSAGPFSFTSQLFDASSHVQKKFAHCLPDRFESLNAPGEIVFGNYKLWPAFNLSYTPLVPPYSPLGNLYYYVDLKGITVGKAFIEVADVMKAQKGEVETRGTIFDSGSALTTLVKPVYNELVKEMKRQTAHLRPFAPKSAEPDLCYKVPVQAEKPPSVPTVTLHFVGRVEMVLGPGSVLYPAESDHKSISFCLAFQRASDSDNRNIIGNYQQQNYWVEYNLHTSSLGLAKARCAK